MIMCNDVILAKNILILYYLNITQKCSLAFSSFEYLLQIILLFKCISRRDAKERCVHEIKTSLKSELEKIISILKPRPKSRQADKIF